MQLVIRYLLLLYQKLRFLFPSNSCRFFPSCSVYAGEAVERHGILCGTFLALLRIIRCNQFFKGGYDPVPVCLEWGFHVKHRGGRSCNI